MSIIFWIFAIIVWWLLLMLIWSLFEEDVDTYTIWFIIFLAVCWSLLYYWWDWLYFNKKQEYIPHYNNYSNNSNNHKIDEEECIEPENPYWDWWWHDAWRNWWEEWNSCWWNSDSFVEWCEEYYSALDEYENCMNNK